MVSDCCNKSKQLWSSSHLMIVTWALRGRKKWGQWGWEGDLTGCTDRAAGAPSRRPLRERIIPEKAGEEQPRLRPDRRFLAGPSRSGPRRTGPCRARSPGPAKHLFNFPAGRAERRGLAAPVGSSPGFAPFLFDFIWVYLTPIPPRAGEKNREREVKREAGGCQPVWLPAPEEPGVGARGRGAPARPSGAAPGRHRPRISFGFRQVGRGPGKACGGRGGQQSPR